MVKILMVSSEAAPFAKTGGLADVLGSLPKALESRGEKVAVVLPLYSKTGHYPPQLGIAYRDMNVWLGWNRYTVHLRHHQEHGVDYFFVDSPELYGRAELYGENGVDYPDNHIRFAVLSHAALGAVRHIFRPNVIHCHDWQTGLIPPLVRHHFRLDPTFYGIKLLFTIHNLGYQGLFPKEVLTQDLGLDSALYRPDLVEFYQQVSFLKAGLVYSDALNTVSPTYAREIQTPDEGAGLEGLLTARSAVLSGILNGVDYFDWSPETDRHIPARFSAADLTGKRECKRALLEDFGLPADDLDRPLIGIVSRWVYQKGFDLIAGIGDRLAQEDVQLVALGTGEPQYESALSKLARRHPDKIGVRIGYDNPLAHRIEAGSDMFLMPSRYEPCGLNQIYSLRYGAIPIVRATGGLDDTVDASTGFKFRAYSADALMGAVLEALVAFRDRKRWRKMVQEAMSRDFSWDVSAAQYSALYRRMLVSQAAA